MMSISPSPSSHPHLLIFPFPAQGHILPLLDLTHHLATHGFTLTILITPKNLPILDPLLSIHPSSITPLILPMPPHPKLTLGVENVKDIGNHGNAPIMLSLRQLHNPIIHWFNSHPSPPLAIISDFFLGWTQQLAHHLQIPRLVFYSSGAFVVNVLYHCWLHVKTIAPSRFSSSNSVLELSHLPNSPRFKKEHLPSVAMAFDESDPDWDLLRDGALANGSSWGTIVNTFEVLEHDHLEHLRQTRVYGSVFGVGPLNVGKPTIGDSNSNHVLTWLDKCPDGSVLYVCFGSQKQLNKQQMEALDSAFRRSGTRFVWVVKTMEEGDDGFRENVSDLGIVVREWVPQVSILNHRAVGGFLSHCGWNSVLESVMAGVMILAWPMEADQFINAKLLVEEMGVAVTVCEGGNSVPDSEALRSVIDECLNGRRMEKEKAKELRKEAADAVGTGGSSWKDMNELIKKLSQLQPSK